MTLNRHLLASIFYLLALLTARAVVFEHPGGSGTGGTGGVYSNNTTTAVIATFYTNDTPHYIEGIARLGYSGAGTLRIDVTNSDNSRFFPFVYDALSVGATSNSLSFKVPPGGWWKFSASGSTATDGTQVLTYNATNGAVTYATSAGSVTDGATQAGLAAGSYPINGVLATNLNEAHGAYSPQHFNIGKTPVMDGLMRSNLPVRVLVFGDTAFIPTTGIINAFTNMGIPVRGTGGASTYTLGNYAYATTAGTTTFTAQEGASNPYVIGTIGMAAGSSLTNIVGLGQSQGIDTDRIAIKHWKNTGFSNLEVYTNSYGGTPTLFQTIDCNVGSFTYFVSTYDVPATISNCVVSVRSTGTNFVAAATIGQWKTNGLSLRLDQYTAANCGLNNFTDSSVLSNMFRTLLTDFDSLVVTDLGGGDYSYGTNLWNMVKENNLKLDVILSTSIIQTNNAIGGYRSRETILDIGRTTPFVVVDTAAILAPTNGTKLDYLYGEVSHLNTIGNNYLGDKFVNALGWNSDNFRTAIPNQTTNYLFVPVNDLRNDAGALTLSHLYSVIGTPYRTWGHYVAAGTYGANSTLVYPANQLGQRKRMYARLLVLTTNAINYSLALNQAVFPVGTNITSWTVPTTETGTLSIGNSGQTNFSYTSWVSIAPTVRGPWAGWLQVGFGGVSKAYACYLLGVEFRADPDNAWDNW